MRLKDGDTAKVRFLVSSEEDVVFYREHYVNKKYIICFDDTDDQTGQCQYCDDGDRPGEKYAFNVIDRKDGKVKVLQLAIGHATQILEFYDEYGAINDRDYRISRHGNISQTRYTFVPLKQSPMDAADKKLAKDKYNLEELYAPREQPKATKKGKKRMTDETEKSPPAGKKKKAEPEPEPEAKPKKKAAPAEEEPKAKKKKAKDDDLSLEDGDD